MAKHTDSTGAAPRAEPDDDSFFVERIEVEFAIPTRIAQPQQRMLHDLIQAMAKDTQPEGHVHWLFQSGSRPSWSQADGAFLGLEHDPEAPASGEPTFDDSVLYLATSCRPLHPGERA